MSNIEPRNLELVRYRGVYAVAVGRGAKRKRFSTGTNDEGLARVIGRRILSRLNGPIGDRVEDLWKAYLLDRSQDKADVSRQETAWKALAPIFGDMVASDVTKDDCRAYAQHRQRQGRANGTFRTELEYLRACLNLHFGKGNSKVWVPSPSAPRDRYLTRPELNKLLEHVMTPHVRLFIELAIATAARMTAILELTWAQVDFDHSTINFNPPQRERTNKRRAVVPMNSRARIALEEALPGAMTDYVIEWDGKPVKSVKKAIREAAKRAGVPCSPHVFRHTAGVWMAQADIPMQKISQFMGHTSVRVTESVYARYSPSFMKDAASALDF